MSWFQEASKAVRDFVDQVGGSFQTSEVREYAEKHGLDPAPDNRAWGTVMRVAARKGVIRHAGYATSVSETRNASPMSVWCGAHA